MSTNDASSNSRMSEIEAQLVSQALQDSEFRNRLISDPKSVLSDQGLVIPDDVQISVLQESPTQYFLVLPAIEGVESGGAIALSDQELETVSGGGTQAVWPNSCVASAPAPSPSPTPYYPDSTGLELY